MIINPVAIVVATIACMGLGSLWYGPLFGEKWMALVGIKKDTISKADMKIAMTQGLIATLLSNVFLALLLLLASTQTLADAVKISLVLALATGVPGALHDIAWERKPLTLFYMNSAHCILNFALAAVIIQALSQ
ncbi:DUF1761 domain-containing protein [Candidatus Peribacteria bacterium]|nr:DUF1761 domain-containing protein [Candidatus Peribacteria bacterium]